MNLPSIGTPPKILQDPSTTAMPLQITRPSSSASRVAKVIHYGDIFLDEEIVISQFDFATMTLDDINMMQAALERKKQQEILRKEYKKRHALQDIKEIFLDAFTLPPLDETKGIMEQLLDIVEQVTNVDLDTNVKLMEWLERKFQGKVNEKISSEIAPS